MSRFESTLGGNGVGVLYPAVLHNGGQIYQQKFEDAVGNEGIERLVGVQTGTNNAHERRAGWKFWRRADI